MTTEEKAKAYEMALELAKKIYNESAGSCCDTANATVKVLEGLFPQLKESEDERLANQLINLVQSAGEVLLVPTNKEELIGWIKKCKESLHISETCKENADSFTDDEDERIRKVLMNILYYAHPSVLASYDVDVKKAIAYLERQKEQKPAEWSEEDELRRKQAVGVIEAIDRYGWRVSGADREDIDAVLDWLKSLRPHPHWKPSEEQLKELNFARLGRTPNVVHEHLDSLYNDLLKLKQQ